MYAVMPLQLLTIAGKCMPRHVWLSQLLNLYSQRDLLTGIFLCEISQIWHFPKAFGSQNYCLAPNGEIHPATVFSASSKCWKAGSILCAIFTTFSGFVGTYSLCWLFKFEDCGARTSGVMGFNLRVHFSKFSAPSDEAIRHMWNVCERDKPFEFRNDFDVRRKCL